MKQPGETYRAVVDFRHGDHPAERLAFDGFDKIITAQELGDVVGALNEVEAACNEGFTAVGFVAYEASPAFDPAMQTFAKKTNLPLVFFGLSKTPVNLPHTSPATSPTAKPFTPEWAIDDYLKRFDAIKQHIYDGDTYQINLTFPLRAEFTDTPLAYYEMLKSAQHSDYCAFLQGPDFSIISASPELFFERQGTHITTRPMKGTRKRGRYQEEDAAIAEELKASAKDRAENVMIVDMLRNDLGRFATTGSVTVPELFAIEKYPTVWQMTSTIEADIESGTSLVDIFHGLFPCGSVTGAPKVKTMELIRQLEMAPRGVYCGAFGVVYPGGDCVFNVPIRTMTIQDGGAEYPVGSGLVADSVGPDEYAECLVKARVLDRCEADFKLLETLLWQNGEFYLLDGHLNRLKHSAEMLGFMLDDAEVCKSLNEAVKGSTEPQRVRLLVADTGACTVESTLLAGHSNAVRTVKLADEPVSADNVFLYHKTTRRDVYDRERNRLAGADDAILYNSSGELTESTIANIAIKLDGTWYTPPVSCGLLPGVMREHLLADGTLNERILTADDLRSNEGLRLMNSVRGFWDVVLVM